MITGIHFLLTYTCTYECDHCFLYCGPHSEGTFTGEQLARVFEEISRMPKVNSVYFEGGEAFLFYPLLLEGVRMARDLDLKVGIVTNGYWATSEKDAEMWLKPLAEMGIADLSISDDAFHYGGEDESPAQKAIRAARKLGLPVDSICIEEARVEAGGAKGEPVIGGGVRLRGRAADKLADGLPTGNWKRFVSCPDEDFENPGRVHIDSFGNVHLCQGLIMGNMWSTPLSKLVEAYDPKAHPIVNPLLEGGPARLAETYNVKIEEEYISECHMCYQVRKALVERFPEYLTPRQVYGLDNEQT